MEQGLFITTRKGSRPSTCALAAPGTLANPRLAVQTTVALSLWAFFKGQLTWLASRGFDVHAISSGGEEASWVAQWGGVTGHSVAMERRMSPARDLRAIIKLARLYRRLDLSIIHSFSPKGGLLGMLAARMARCPVKIYTIWGLPDFSKQSARSMLMKSADKISSSIADIVYVESESLRAPIISHGICHPQKLRVLPAWSVNSLTPEFLRLDDVDKNRQRVRDSLGIPPQGIVIGFVGRIVRDKGIEELVSAFMNMAAHNPAIFLLLVGSEEKFDPISPETSAAIRSHRQIRMVGFQTDVRQFLCAMDILAHPSYREGLPTAPLEAAALQLPVITSKIPGCVDAVLHEKTGLLVQPRDTGTLTQAFARYVANPDLRKEHGLNGRKRVLKEFDLEEIWEQLRSDYLAAKRYTDRNAKA